MVKFFETLADNVFRHNYSKDFKLGGAYLKKLRRAEGSANFFGVFRVRIRDFMPNKQITESPSYP
jgi:hypothetical protein